MTNPKSKPAKYNDNVVPNKGTPISVCSGVRAIESLHRVSITYE
jgi:hypothetical protein